mgnify:CR=1 FL=1
MKQSLDMRQGQSLVMTPQLQQAIKLLQLSNQELSEFVEAEIERNPLLNKAEEEPAPSSEDTGPDNRQQLSLDESSGLGEARDQLDAPGEDVYEPGTGSDAAMPAGTSGPSAKADWSGVGGGGSGEDFDYTANLSTDISLREHLHTQLNLAGLSAADRLIAARLIDEAAPFTPPFRQPGWFTLRLESIREQVGRMQNNAL